MNPTDLVIITLFLIVIVYVVNRAIASVDKQTKVIFDSKGLEQQLESQTFNDTKLKDIFKVSFAFKPEERFKFSAQPKAIGMTIENTSEKVDIYVYWDKSTLTGYGNESRRIARLVPGKTPCIPNSRPPAFQATSPVAPKSKLSASLTAEDLLEPNDEKTALEPKKPILDVEDLEKKSKDKKTPKPLKDKWKKFDEREATLEFSLRLMLGLLDRADNTAKEHQYALWCKFTVINMPWFDHLPWIPKK